MNCVGPPPFARSPPLIKETGVPFWLKPKMVGGPSYFFSHPPPEVEQGQGKQQSRQLRPPVSGFRLLPPASRSGTRQCRCACTSFGLVADVTGDKGLKLTPDKGVSKVINILVDGVEPYRRKSSGKGEACNSVETVNKAGNS